jgi:acetyl-CoA acyltransferase 2
MGHALSDKIYLVGGMRTAFGKFGGSLRELEPTDLCLYAAKSVITGLSLKPEQFDQVIVSNVIPSTPATLYTARHLALKLSMPVTTPALMLNRLCGSGIEAIIQARSLIASGQAECILVAGVENMSLIPHLTYGARFGTKYGALKNRDFLLDTLTDEYACLPMGMTAENLAKEFGITRQDSDAFSCQSHQKAHKAKAHLAREITSVAFKGGELLVDEHVRHDVSLEEMGRLKPSFEKDGVVTPASASGIVDGAAVVVVASEEFVRKNQLRPLALIGASSCVGVDPKRMGIGPVPAIQKLVKNLNQQVKDIDLFEINEAFAPQVMACQKSLGIPSEKLNIWGGAIALGHPLGASGVRIALTLSRQLQVNQLKSGVASACIGGGQGIALYLSREGECLN